MIFQYVLACMCIYVFSCYVSYKEDGEVRIKELVIFFILSLIPAINFFLLAVTLWYWVKRFNWNFMDTVIFSKKKKPQKPNE